MPLFDQSSTPAPIAEPRRKRDRRRVLKGAQIVFAHRGAAIDCVVRNMSDGGACLKVFSPVGIPDTFELRLDSDSVRCCRVVWRKATQIGVEFT
jgi:PilZ domain